MASHTTHWSWFPTWNYQPPQPNRGAAPTVGRCEPAEVSTPPRTGQQSSSSQSTPIQRSLMGNSAPSAPLTIPTTSKSWLTENMPTGLADRTYAKWLKDLPLSDVQRNVLTTNITKQKHGGISIQLKHLKQFRKLLWYGHSNHYVEQKLQCYESHQNPDCSNQHDELASSAPPQKAQAQVDPILSSGSSFDDPGHFHPHTLHYGFYHLSFSRGSNHPNPHEGFICHRCRLRRLAPNGCPGLGPCVILHRSGPEDLERRSWYIPLVGPCGK